MTYLVLIRHGLSDYNKKGLWTGWLDPDLAPEGIEQAKTTAQSLTYIHFDLAYTSVFRRAKQTLNNVLEVLNQKDLPIVEAWQINEKNYGEYTNKNKWQVKEEVGEDVFNQIRRSWDFPIPAGESLKQVYERMAPYYDSEIKPKIIEGKNIIIASSGNSLRALVKHLENIPVDQIGDLEIGTGEAYVYQMDHEGNVLSKEIKGENPDKGKV